MANSDLQNYIYWKHSWKKNLNSFSKIKNYRISIMTYSYAIQDQRGDFQYQADLVNHISLLICFLATEIWGPHQTALFSFQALSKEHYHDIWQMSNQ